MPTPHRRRETALQLLVWIALLSLMAALPSLMRWELEQEREDLERALARWDLEGR